MGFCKSYLHTYDCLKLSYINSILQTIMHVHTYVYNLYMSVHVYKIQFKNYNLVVYAYFYVVVYISTVAVYFLQCLCVVHIYVICSSTCQVKALQQSINCNE